MALPLPDLKFSLEVLVRIKKKYLGFETGTVLAFLLRVICCFLVRETSIFITFHCVLCFFVYGNSICVTS